MKNITIDQWNSHPSYSDDLQALLANPVMEIALQVAFDKGYDPFPALSVPGGDLTAHLAAQGCLREGYRMAFQNLRNLTKPKVRVKQDQRKPWEATDKPAVS